MATHCSHPRMSGAGHAASASCSIPGGHPQRASGLLEVSREGEVPEAALLPESHRVISGLLAPSQKHCPPAGTASREEREKKSTLSQQILALLSAEALQLVYETPAANPRKQRGSRPPGEGCCVPPSRCLPPTYPASTNGRAPGHPCPQQHRDQCDVT